MQNLNIGNRGHGGVILQMQHRPIAHNKWPPKLLKDKVKLYKHLLKKHADNLVKSGEIKIGTFGIFRSSEETDPSRVDPNEGKFIQNIDDYKSDQDGALEPYTLPAKISHFTQNNNAQGQIIRNIALGYKVPDGYAYCMSTSRTKTTNDLFKDAGACVEILDVEKFFRVIGEKLATINPLLSVTPNLDLCRYRERYGSLFEKLDYGIEFIKEKKYEREQEVRAFWWPESNENIQLAALPILTIPELVGCCKIVDLT